MEMGDWTYGLAIALCAVLWVTIFVDYRKKLMRVMPGVEQVSGRKQEFSNKISEIESSAKDTVLSIDDMRREIEKLEEQRQDLQDKLNEQEMLSIPAGRLKMGSDEVGRENENPEHVVQIKAFYVDRFEVTNMQYKDFVDATERRTPVH